MGPIACKGFQLLTIFSLLRVTKEGYPFNLRDAIPTFPLPLQPGDPKPAIDLQSLLQAITESDWEWLQTCLQETGDSPVVTQGDRAKSP